MNHDAERRAEGVIQKLRKLKGFCPMSAAEADAAYDAAPAAPLSDEDIESMIEFVVLGENAPWEPSLDLRWADEINTSDVEDDALQIHRNKGEDTGDTAAEDQLREEMLSDDEDEDGVDGGEEPPFESR